MKRLNEDNIISVEEETVVRTPKVAQFISEVSATGGSFLVKGDDGKGESERHTIRMAKIEVKLAE